MSSLAGVSANTLRAVCLQSIPSSAPVINEHLLLVGEHLCGIKLPCNGHCPQDLCWVQIMAQTEFPFPKEGRAPPPTRAASRISHERNSSAIEFILGCWGFKVWPPVTPFPKHRRQSYARIISWQTLALARGIKREVILEIIFFSLYALLLSCLPETQFL